MKPFVVHAQGCEWGHPVAVCTTRCDAEAFVSRVWSHRRRAPVVNWDNQDQDVVDRQFERFEQFQKRCPGGVDAFLADSLSVLEFRVWKPAR